MRLCTEIINFVGLDFLQDTDEVGSISQITVVKLQLWVRAVRIFVDMIDAFGIE